MTTDREQILDNMLSKRETTNRADFPPRFPHNPITPPGAKTMKTIPEKPMFEKQRAPVFGTYSNTLAQWIDNVPFGLFTKYDKVINYNPWHVQQPYEKPKDVLLEEVKRTRPRLAMSPASSLDNIEDPRARAALIDDTYLTIQQAASRDTASALSSNRIKAPLPDFLAPPNPLKIPGLQYPYVSPEWKMDSVYFDNKSPRIYCQPTRQFWQHRKPTQFKICDQRAAVAAMRKRR